jgi:aminopeptidase N
MGLLSADTVRSKKLHIIYGTVCVILGALFLGFLIAFVVQKNASSDSGTDGGSTTTPPSTLPPTNPPPNPDDIRLDETIVPKHVELLVESDPNANNFKGEVAIDFDVISQSASSFRIHGKGLDFTGYALTTSSGSAVSVRNVEEKPEFEYWVITPESPLAIGSYTVKIQFAATFGENQIPGFYRSVYTTLDN